MSEGTLTASHPPARQPLLRLLSDARLAKLAAQGSTAAFAAIYERHHQELYRYCRSIVRDEHDARDALQNTMVKALRGLAGESREIAVRPWLFRIAHNESISLLRRRPAEATIDTAAELAAIDADPETRQRLRNLIADLELLAPRQRSALVMRELSGLEFDEIAAALGTSPAAAKQAVYEARVALLELEEGRDLSCEEVCRKISAEDRRLLRGRRVRAHLKACADCRRFAEVTRERSGQLAAIAPPLPVPVAIGILEGILGGGGGGGGIAALLGGGGAAGIGGAAAAKLGVAGLIVLGAGAVAIERGSHDGAPRAKAADEITAPGKQPGTAQAEPVAISQGSGSDAGAGNAGGKSQGSEGNRQHGGPSAAAEPATGPPGSASSQGAANGNGPASTPPGHGGTSPGHGGAPPGLGTTPPGHGGTPPGQPNQPPRQANEPPGQANEPAGQQGTAPGLAGNIPPGHGGAPPGHADEPVVAE